MLSAHAIDSYCDTFFIAYRILESLKIENIPFMKKIFAFCFIALSGILPQVVLGQNNAKNSDLGYKIIHPIFENTNTNRSFIDFLSRQID